ncbi:MAG: hypothetical protein WDZ90_00640 [Candidatus Paceibacterota bacterium]
MSVPTALSAPAGEDIEEVSIEENVRSYFKDIPVMAKIARCESHFRHFGSDGSVLRGDIVPSDVGVMQINEYFHADTAEALGLDLHTLPGNLAYARDLFEREGTTPWLASVKCWGRDNHIARK